LFSNYQKTDVFMECHKVGLEIEDDHANFVFYKANDAIAVRVAVIEPTDVTAENVETISHVWMDGFLEKNKNYILMEAKNDSDTTE